MRIRFAWIAAGVIVVAAGTATSSAQSNFGPFVVDTTGKAPTAGWIFTPSLLYSTVWDDNALLQGNGDLQPGDLLNVINPSATLAYNGKRTQVNGSYDGSFLLYRQYGTLDSYDQHGSLTAREFLTPHVSVFVRNFLGIAPTTQAVQLVAVPFVRTGSDIYDLHGGVDAELSNRLSLSGSYNFEWVKFDATPAFAELLQGGHAHGATAIGRYRVGSLTTVTGTYNLQRATVADGLQTFNVQQMMGGVEQRLTQTTTIGGEIGISRLDVNTIGGLSQTGLAFLVRLNHQVQKAFVGASYSRSFVPSYSFGGTFQNEELGAHFDLPVIRRVYAASSFAWRRNQPLASAGPSLYSVWYEGHFGYALRPWARLEGFYAREHQSIARPGGILDRNRLGFQVITSTPMRLR